MKPARIFIVEDDRVVARDIQQQLAHIGHTVVGTTSRGEDVLELVMKARPDLVLMDIRLEGELDGIDAAHQIREHLHSPVVFLTAYADDETVRRASLTEPFGYLLKPFEELQLRTAIDMALYKHQAERKLRESERRYATTLSSIGDAVIATDDFACVTFMNPVAESLTGWTQQDAAGEQLSKVFRVINQETSKPGGDPSLRALPFGAEVDFANQSILIAKDGREIRIDECSSPIIDDQGETTGAVLIFRDITQKSKMEEALKEAQDALARVGRLTAMGELTVSIAHEVNQPLMAIVTNAAACVQWLKDENLNLHEARQAAERIIRHGHRAGDVIAGVRALSRKSPIIRAKLDINDAISEVLVLMRNELRRNHVSVRTDLSPETGSAFGDRVQVQQVMLNLMMNSVEAMSETPESTRLLYIETRRDKLATVLISIQDTGIGIDPDNNDRVFEAFFTTKPKGVGMGLSICRSIVERHDGRLWVTPNLPHGTIFHFTIPAFADGDGIASDQR
jgi:PAS domain S-box-containing protein